MKLNSEDTPDFISAIEDYFEVVTDACEECLFNSKYDGNGKCND